MQATRLSSSLRSTVASLRRCRAPLALMALTLGAVGAQAQSTAASDAGWSWIPYTQRGYVGLSVGRSDYDLNCGGAFSCDTKATSWSVYSGGMFTPNFGAEIGYRHMGSISRFGGDTSAQGITLNLVAQVDIDRFTAYAKAGGIYRRTKVSTDPISGVGSGKDTGWGPSFTVGVGYNIDRNYSVAIERTHDRYAFVGYGRAYVDSTNLSLRYRF